MSALAAMQDKTTHLENSLSAETRLKLDLFSALGEAKRQMEIHHGTTVQSCFYIESRIGASLNLVNLVPVILIATWLKLSCSFVVGETRGGPCQHGFMCGCKQWSNDINESY